MKPAAPTACGSGTSTDVDGGDRNRRGSEEVGDVSRRATEESGHDPSRPDAMATAVEDDEEEVRPKDPPPPEAPGETSVPRTLPAVGPSGLSLEEMVEALSRDPELVRIVEARMAALGAGDAAAAATTATTTTATPSPAAAAEDKSTPRRRHGDETAFSRTKRSDDEEEDRKPAAVASGRKEGGGSADRGEVSRRVVRAVLSGRMGQGGAAGDARTSAAVLSSSGAYWDDDGADFDDDLTPPGGSHRGGGSHHDYHRHRHRQRRHPRDRRRQRRVSYDRHVFPPAASAAAFHHGSSGMRSSSRSRSPVLSPPRVASLGSGGGGGGAFRVYRGRGQRSSFGSAPAPLPGGGSRGGLAGLDQHGAVEGPPPVKSVSFSTISVPHHDHNEDDGDDGQRHSSTLAEDPLPSSDSYRQRFRGRSVSRSPPPPPSPPLVPFVGPTAAADAEAVGGGSGTVQFADDVVGGTQSAGSSGRSSPVADALPPSPMMRSSRNSQQQQPHYGAYGGGARSRSRSRSPTIATMSSVTSALSAQTGESTASLGPGEDSESLTSFYTGNSGSYGGAGAYRHHPHGGQGGQPQPTVTFAANPREYGAPHVHFSAMNPNPHLVLDGSGHSGSGRGGPAPAPTPEGDISVSIPAPRVVSFYMDPVIAGGGDEGRGSDPVPAAQRDDEEHGRGLRQPQVAFAADPSFGRAVSWEDQLRDAHRHHSVGGGGSAGGGASGTNSGRASIRSGLSSPSIEPAPSPPLSTSRSPNSAATGGGSSVHFNSVIETITEAAARLRDEHRRMEDGEQRAGGDDPEAGDGGRRPSLPGLDDDVGATGGGSAAGSLRPSTRLVHFSAMRDVAVVDTEASAAESINSGSRGRHRRPRQTGQHRQGVRRGSGGSADDRGARSRRQQQRRGSPSSRSPPPGPPSAATATASSGQEEDAPFLSSSGHGHAVHFADDLRRRPHDRNRHGVAAAWPFSPASSVSSDEDSYRRRRQEERQIVRCSPSAGAPAVVATTAGPPPVTTADAETERVADRLRRIIRRAEEAGDVTLEGAFAHFDRSHTGTVSARDLREGLVALGESFADFTVEECESLLECLTRQYGGEVRRRYDSGSEGLETGSTVGINLLGFYRAMGRRSPPLLLPIDVDGDGDRSDDAHRGPDGVVFGAAHPGLGGYNGPRSDEVDLDNDISRKSQDEGRRTSRGRHECDQDEDDDADGVEQFVPPPAVAARLNAASHLRRHSGGGSDLARSPVVHAHDAASRLRDIVLAAEREDGATLESSFRLLDQDGTGYVSAEDFRRGLRRLGRQFLEQGGSSASASDDEDADDHFDGPFPLDDEDGAGTFSSINSEDCEELVALFDANNDGLVSLLDFYRFMGRRSPPPSVVTTSAGSGSSAEDENGDSEEDDGEREPPVLPSGLASEEVRDNNTEGGQSLLSE